MASATSQPTKRKRGRPAGASQREDASSSSQPRADVENDDARPKKRSRRTGDDQESSLSRQRSTRDRESGEGSNRRQTGGDEQPGRNRSSKTTVDTKTKPANGAKAPKTSKTTTKKAGRPSLNADAKSSRGRGRPRTSGVSSIADAEATDTPSSAKRARGRPTKQKAAESSRQPASSQQEEEATPESASRQPKKRGRRPRSQIEEQENEPGRETERAAEEEDAEEEQHDDTEDENQEPEGADVPYQHLVPRTRLIPLATMTSKWAPLEPDAIAAVQALLNDCARPVLARLQYGSSTSASLERRHEQVRQAIAGATRRLRSKLVKGIPFPPATSASGKSGASRGGGDGSGARATKAARLAADAHAADFNYERTLEAVQALEQQLDPLQHAIALLTRERAREERALENDYMTLHQLETNAQAESRTWRQDARRAHVLAPVDTGGPKGGLLGQVGLVKQPTREDGENDDVEGGIFETTDKDLQTLSTQLGNHMDSLKGNLQQIEGVVPAIVQSRAALQHVLHQSLDAEQYGHIVLGH